MELEIQFDTFLISFITFLNIFILPSTLLHIWKIIILTVLLSLSTNSIICHFWVCYYWLNISFHYMGDFFLHLANFYWMPDILNFTLLDARYFYVPKYTWGFFLWKAGVTRHNLILFRVVLSFVGRSRGEFGLLIFLHQWPNTLLFILTLWIMMLLLLNYYFGW